MNMQELKVKYNSSFVSGSHISKIDPKGMKKVNDRSLWSEFEHFEGLRYTDLMVSVA